MSKRATCLLIVFGGFAVFYVLFRLGGPGIYPPNISHILAQMILWGALSAAVAAALTPGRWSEPIVKGESQFRILPRWIWPVLFVLLAVVNFLVAIAVFLGASAFASSPIPDSE